MFAPPTGKLDITPDDPRWIGAWWGGFLLCGALLFFSSLPMFGFPQSLPPRPERAGESEQAMLPEREYERPKPSNGVLRHPLDGESSTTCFQQLRGEALVVLSARLSSRPSVPPKVLQKIGGLKFQSPASNYRWRCPHVKEGLCST